MLCLVAWNRPEVCALYPPSTLRERVPCLKARMEAEADLGDRTLSLASALALARALIPTWKPRPISVTASASFFWMSCWDASGAPGERDEG